MSDDAAPMAEGDRLSRARQLVKRYTAASVAPALVPVPLVDLGLIFGVQLKLLHALAGLYEVPFSESRSRALVASLAGGAFPVSLAMSVGRLLPGLGTVAGAATVGVMGGASTYAIGHVFVQHFESGGTFLSFDPEKVRAHYAALFAEGRAEVRASPDAPARTRRP